ncbi:hypothetical protein [Vibrio hyugaensis]|uniref:hypothetical protein n=1 Tax=Vibrio hyugaensis TaxID=1534743 RepID=UPI003DA0922D
MIKMLVIDKVRPKQLVAQSLNGNSNQSNKTDKFCGGDNNSRKAFEHDLLESNKQKRTPPRVRLLLVKIYPGDFKMQDSERCH